MRDNGALAAELAAWNARVRAARAEYERAPITALAGAASRAASETVPVDQYLEVVRANGELARRLREAERALAEAGRQAARAGAPPREFSSYDEEPPTTGGHP